MDESDYHADGALFRHGGCFMREQADAWRPRGAEEADVSAQGGHHHQDRRAGEDGALLGVALCCVIFLGGKNDGNSNSILDICRRRRGHCPWRIFSSCGEILDVETF